MLRVSIVIYINLTNTSIQPSSPIIIKKVQSPSSVPNISKARWFVSFIDDCTRVSWIFLLKHKSYMSFVLQNFHNMIKNQFGVTIKRFWSDNPKRFLSHQMLISTRVSPIFLLLIFKGRIPSRKTRIKIPISLISLSLTLIQSLVQCPIQYSYRTSLNLSRRRRLSLLRRNK